MKLNKCIPPNRYGMPALFYVLVCVVLLYLITVRPDRHGYRISKLNVRNDKTPIQKLLASNISSIFGEDFVPNVYKETQINGTVHFCLIAANAKRISADEIKLFVKSVILHARRSDVFFHFVVFKGTEITIPPIFAEIMHAFVNVRYELREVNLTRYLNMKLQNKVRVTHAWSGLYGIGKIFMYDLLSHVNQCIVIDTDTLFGTDPAFLWSEAQSRLRQPVAVATTWFAGDSYFNSGVMLHNFDYMNKISFGDLITLKSCKSNNESGSEIYKCSHDQQLLNTMERDHKKMFDHFTGSWNLGYCQSFRKFPFDSFADDKTGLFFGIVHFTCQPAKAENAIKAAKKKVKKTLQDYIDLLEAIDFRRCADKKIQRV